LSATGFRRAALAAGFLFVGGVGLVTEGEKLGVSSGVAAIIKASVPLWVAVFEALRPQGERLGKVAIGGLVAGACGVVWLVLPRLSQQAASSSPTEPLGIGLLILSALLFAIGALLIRHRPPSNSSVHNSAWMMVLGGLYLLLLGMSLGELPELQSAEFTGSVVSAFLFLLLVHSLAAFSAMNWLLAHLPAAIVTTKFYVSPAIAVFAGWLVLHESITPQTLASLALILGGVGFTLWAQARKGHPSSH
jgi:drug/metabolite transporter (DMT)-like permease